MSLISKYCTYMRQAIVNMLNVNDTVPEAVHYRQRHDYLTHLAMHSDVAGTTSEKLVADGEVIVSLTTHGQRLYDVYLAIESVMQGTVLPNRILLWLPEELRETVLPIYLQRQVKRGLEIVYCPDQRSYTKLLPSLLHYPDANIVTIDDDILYPADMLEHLVEMHRQHPTDICCNVLHPLPSPISSKTRHLMRGLPFVESYGEAMSRYFFEGYAGILYPSHCFSDEVFNDGVYQQICPTADDIWFSAMAMINGVTARCAYPHLGQYKAMTIPHVQDVGLQNINTYGPEMNDVQLRAVFEHYGLK